ncbi:MAG: hypothetical protein JRJ41_11885 [Deltaproteobacteria bacterium]|nr:hypothetical protein [Deltaproteobacteria bacterium]
MEKKDDLRDRLFKVTSDFKEQMEKPLPSLDQWEHELKLKMNNFDCQPKM